MPSWISTKPMSLMLPRLVFFHSPTVFAHKNMEKRSWQFAQTCSFSDDFHFAAGRGPLVSGARTYVPRTHVLSSGPDGGNEAEVRAVVTGPRSLVFVFQGRDEQ